MLCSKSRSTHSTKELAHLDFQHFLDSNTKVFTLSRRPILTWEGCPFAAPEARKTRGS